MASKCCGLQKPPRPLSNEAAARTGWSTGNRLRKTGGAEAPPSEPPKTGGKNDEAAGPAEKLRLSSQRLHERPISATPFFDVDLRRSIAAGVATDQAGDIARLKKLI